jgi:hypothetical protein
MRVTVVNKVAEAVREIQIVAYITTFSHDNGRIMSRGEKAGSGGRRKHSCNVTSFLC